MRVPIRKTAQGTEYWDTEKKLIVIGSNSEGLNSGVGIDDETTDINLDKMDVDQLLSFASHNNIDVPGNMKKEETIRNHIAEQLAADAE